MDDRVGEPAIVGTDGGDHVLAWRRSSRLAASAEGRACRSPSCHCGAAAGQRARLRNSVRRSVARSRHGAARRVVREPIATNGLTVATRGLLNRRSRDGASRGLPPRRLRPRLACRVLPSGIDRARRGHATRGSQVDHGALPYPPRCTRTTTMAPEAQLLLPAAPGDSGATIDTVPIAAGERPPPRPARRTTSKRCWRGSTSSPAPSWRRSQCAAANPDERRPPAAASPGPRRRTSHGRPRLATTSDDDDDEWRPLEPQSLKDAGITEGQLEHLVLKCLGACGDMSGRDLSEQHAVPFRLLEPVLQAMKLAPARGVPRLGADERLRLPAHRHRPRAGEEAGRALQLLRRRAGAAGVVLRRASPQQSLTKKHPTQRDLERAFADLLINKHMLRRLGPAVNSGRGMFLYGQPGNGKTSIAERVTAAFGDCIWIPRAIGVDGEIMRVFDPSLHHEAPLNEPTGPLQTRPVDRRWVRIRRPTIVVGGELTMDALEVHASAGIERQRSAAAAEEQLRHAGDRRLRPPADDDRRAAQPLDRAAGKAVRLPANCPTARRSRCRSTSSSSSRRTSSRRTWSTTRSCGAFRTRSRCSTPREEEFRELFKIMAPKLGIQFDQTALDYLIDKHYRSGATARSAAASRATCCCRSSTTAAT